MRSLLISLWVFLFSALSVHAQVTYYTTGNSDLLSDQVTDIRIADDGTVWIVHANTQENSGLVSGFDGNDWDLYGDLPEIHDAVLYGNTLILGTRAGIYKYFSGAFIRIEAFGESDCRNVQIYGNMLWVKNYPSAYLDSETLSKYDLATDTLKQNWLVSDDFHLLGIDDDGGLWCKSDCLYRYDGIRWQCFRDIAIERSDLIPSYGLFPDMVIDDNGTIWLGADSDYHAITFDGTTFSRTTESVGNVVVGSDGTVWSSLSTGIYRYRSNQRDLVYLTEMEYPTSCLAITDSTLWVGGDGVTVISLEYLASIDPIGDDSVACSLEPFATASEPPAYGDDFWYFPLHIGDTWTYSRSINSASESFSYSDTVMNTVVDTLTVDGEICFLFLDGKVFGIDHTGLIFENSQLRFSFEEPENTEFQFLSPYGYYSPVTRTYRTIAVPAGDFMGYSFSVEGTLGAYEYRVVPGIGLVAESWVAEGKENTHELLSAIIDGKTIDQIVSVDNAPEPYNLNITAYPNPFNPVTTISFTLPESATVTLTVYSASGQKVTTLADGQMSAGTHTVPFDGSGLASGVYLYCLESSGYGCSGKMLFMK